MHTDTWLRQSFLHSTVIALFVLSMAPPASAQKLWPFKGDGAALKTFKDAAFEFSVGYPKDWRIGPGAGDVLVTFSQHDSEAALVVERFRLKAALDSADITDAFVDAELDKLKSREPNVADVTARLVDIKTHRVVVLDYKRVRLGQPERARQYSIAVGEQLYRLICSATAKAFPKYDPLFLHVAESFDVAAAAQPTQQEW